MSNYEVSFFDNVSQRKPTPMQLDKWLRRTIKPSEKLNKLVVDYRNGKIEKTKIPCITVSATFNGVRDLNHIDEKNGLLCIDIDRKDNPFADFDEVKRYTFGLPWVLYCGYSVSGNGLYIIIVTNKKKPLEKYFSFFKKYFNDKGILIDKSCKDYTRLRFFSIDRSAYYNPDAKCFKIPKKVKVSPAKKSTAIRKNDLEKATTIVELSEQHSIDITSDYADWVKIAGALYNSFGEQGRELFHRLSRQYPDYKEKKADKKFNQCMKMNKVGLGTFFYIAESYGLKY